MITISSPKKRRWYFIAFAILFVVSIPLVTLYATGYRLNDHGEFVATGGIALSQVPNDGEVYFEYQVQKKGSVLNRDFFVQNLVPKEYLVVVAKPGYWSWAKRLEVKEKRVAHASVFILPKTPKLTPMLEFIPEEKSGGAFSFFSNDATGTAERNPLYTIVRELFTEPIISPASTTPLDSGRVTVWKEENDFVAAWRGADQDVPEFLCPKSPCARKVPFFSLTPSSVSATPPANIAFFPGRDDVVLFSTKDGVYGVEIDQRPEQNLQPVYLETGAEFRVYQGQIYIKSKEQYFQVEL